MGRRRGGFIHHHIPAAGQGAFQPGGAHGFKTRGDLAQQARSTVRVLVRAAYARHQAFGNGGKLLHGSFKLQRRRFHALVLFSDDLLGFFEGRHVHIKAQTAKAGLVLVIHRKHIGQHVDAPALVPCYRYGKIAKILALADALANSGLTTGIIVKKLGQGLAKAGSHRPVDLKHIQAFLVGVGCALVNVHQQVGQGHAAEYAVQYATGMACLVGKLLSRRIQFLQICRGP